MSEARGYRVPTDRPGRAASKSRSASRASRQNPTPAPSEQASTETGSTRSSSPYNRNFQQNLVDHGVFPAHYRYPDNQAPPLPCNWNEINNRLRVRRPSLSPSRFTEGDFANFQAADAGAFKEKQVSERVISVVEGQIKNEQCRAGGVVFRNLEPLTDGNITPGNPDIYEGARPEQLARHIRQELREMIVPTTQEDLPICPNFFVAAKGPDGSLAVAMRQACYDGALGARGIHSLLNYKAAQPESDASAHTITAIYHGGTLKLYTVHRAEPVEEQGRPGYYTHQLRSYAMTDTPNTFREGAAAFRNARDWAQEQRDEAITRANGMVPTLHDECEVADQGVSATRASVECEKDEPYIADESLSPESARYATPPTEQISVASPRVKTPTTQMARGKRDHGQLPSSSPMQSQHIKRNRFDTSYEGAKAAVVEISTVPAGVSTSASFQMSKYSLEHDAQDAHDEDGRADGLSSDEEEIHNTIEA